MSRTMTTRRYGCAYGWGLMLLIVFAGAPAAAVQDKALAATQEGARLLQNEQDDKASFLRAAELNPGNAELHQRAAMSSFRLSDFDAAWKHALLAHQGGGPTSSSARATSAGQQALMIARPDVYEMMRVTRQTLEESVSFGLVGRPDMARYVLVIDIDDLENGKLDGYVKLKDPRNGEDVYRRVLELRDISNRGDLNAEIRRNIGYVEEWLQEQS